MEIVITTIVVVAFMGYVGWRIISARSNYHGTDGTGGGGSKGEVGRSEEN